MSTDPSRLDAIATRWSLVRAAHASGKPEDAAAARQALVLRYARAIRRQLSSTVPSMGVPSASLKRYFISQICSAMGVSNRDMGANLSVSCG